MRLLAREPLRVGATGYGRVTVMGNDWDGDRYELVDTGTMFAAVKKRRPAEKSVQRRPKLRCGHQKDDGKLCRRVAPCPEHYPQ